MANKKKRQTKFTRREQDMGWELFMIRCPEVVKLQNLTEQPRLDWVIEQKEADATSDSYSTFAITSSVSPNLTRRLEFHVGRKLFGFRILTEVHLIGGRKTPPGSFEPVKIYQEWADEDGQSMDDLLDEARMNGFLAYVDWRFKEWMEENYGR